MMRGGVNMMMTQSFRRIPKKRSIRSPFRQKDSIQITGPPLTQGFYF